MADTAAKTIEQKWQKKWDEAQSFRAAPDLKKPKLYILDMFPLPVGGGAPRRSPGRVHRHRHFSRFKRMQGFNVLHPMGWDAFGLPAENHAIATGQHPRDVTRKERGQFPTADQGPGVLLRLGPGNGHHRSRLLQMDPMDLPAVVQERVGRMKAWRPSTFVPLPDGVGQRRSAPGRLRAVRHRRGTADMRQWLLKITALRRSAVGRPGRAGLAGIHPGHAAQLDRSIGRGGSAVHGGFARARRGENLDGLHHPAGHVVRRDLHGVAPEHPMWTPSRRR
jgi:hypothetical protein